MRGRGNKQTSGNKGCKAGMRYVRIKENRELWELTACVFFGIVFIYCPLTQLLKTFRQHAREGWILTSIQLMPTAWGSHKGAAGSLIPSDIL